MIDTPALENRLPIAKAYADMVEKYCKVMEKRPYSLCASASALRAWVDKTQLLVPLANVNIISWHPRVRLQALQISNAVQHLTESKVLVFETNDNSVLAFGFFQNSFSWASRGFSSHGIAGAPKTFPFMASRKLARVLLSWHRLSSQQCTSHGMDPLDAMSHEPCCVAGMGARRWRRHHADAR